MEQQFLTADFNGNNLMEQQFLTADGVPFQLGMTVYYIQYWHSDSSTTISHHWFPHNYRFDLKIRDGIVYQLDGKNKWVELFKINEVYATLKGVKLAMISCLEGQIEDIQEEIANLKNEIDND